MVTKLIAGRIAMAAGCRMAIADGRAVGALGALIDGKARCSWFLPEASPLSARKKWIKGSLKTAGALIVDDGAVRALSAGKSLLPAGVTAIDGEFRRGDVVDVKDRAGRVLARGLVAYAAEDARRIAGRKSAEIEQPAGFPRPGRDGPPRRPRGRVSGYTGAADERSDQARSKTPPPIVAELGRAREGRRRGAAQRLDRRQEHAR